MGYTSAWLGRVVFQPGRRKADVEFIRCSTVSGDQPVYGAAADCRCSSVFSRRAGIAESPISLGPRWGWSTEASPLLIGTLSHCFPPVFPSSESNPAASLPRGSYKAPVCQFLGEDAFGLSDAKLHEYQDAGVFLCRPNSAIAGHGEICLFFSCGRSGSSGEGDFLTSESAVEVKLGYAADPKKKKGGRSLASTCEAGFAA